MNFPLAWGDRLAQVTGRQSTGRKAMASRLKAVVPKAARPSKPQILVYGKPGVGKTWAALDFPSVYFIDAEQGANLAHYTDKLLNAGGMYLGTDEGANDFVVVIDQIKALCTERHHFRTVVIDSISILFNNAVAEEAENLGNKDQYGASKKAAIQKMRILMRWLRKLDMNVLLIAHSMPEWGMVEGKREQIGDIFDAWDRLEYELHLCLQVTEQGKSRYASVRKSRLEQFPKGERFPWSYDEFADRFGRGVIEADAMTVKLAPGPLVAEIEKLLTVVKVPEGWEHKFLSDNDAETWAEVTEVAAEAVIKRLRANIEQVKEAAA
jgi:hypothetical protein